MANTNYISRHSGEQIDNAVDDVGLLNSKVADLELGAYELNTKVSSLETNVSSLNTDVSALNTDVSELNVGVSTLGTNVNTLDGDMRNVKNRLSIAENSISNLGNDVTEIQNRDAIHLVTVTFSNATVGGSSTNRTAQIRFLFKCSIAVDITRNNFTDYLDNNTNDWMSFLTFEKSGGSLGYVTTSSLKRPTIEIGSTSTLFDFGTIYVGSDSSSVRCSSSNITSFADYVMNF